MRLSLLRQVWLEDNQVLFTGKLLQAQPAVDGIAAHAACNCHSQQLPQQTPFASGCTTCLRSPNPEGGSFVASLLV